MSDQQNKTKYKCALLEKDMNLPKFNLIKEVQDIRDAEAWVSEKPHLRTWHMVLQDCNMYEFWPDWVPLPEAPKDE